MNCRKCGQAGEFYVSEPHLCKECVKSRVRVHRNANIERCRAYDRDRAKTNPKRRAHLLGRLQWLVKTKPAARRAHILVGNAVRDRRLLKQPCEVCGSTKVVAHHDDYLRPLDVRWLCQPYHAQWHIANGPGANYDAPIPERAA